MRTTISIDDEVLRRPKLCAAQEDRTLGELVTAALRERLGRRSTGARTRFKPVTWAGGGTLPGVDLTSNAAVRDLIDED